MSLQSEINNVHLFNLIVVCSVPFYLVSCLFKKNQTFPKIPKGLLLQKSFTDDQSVSFNLNENKNLLIMRHQSADQNWPAFPYQTIVLFF